MLKVGTKLANGKYRIDSYLASGGFGNTYMATDLTFDEKVAIKELYIKGVCGRTANSADVSISLSENRRSFAAHQEKFRKEAKRIRKLSNPHIVSVHDLFDENGTSYYVMDFVEGESLSARLKRTKTPLSEAELMLLLPQILDALECIHAQSIWHLDLKPANIMVDAKGNVQLIDFGASKQVRNASGDSLSTSSAMAYTDGYASSEQMEQNLEKFGPWTDLYSLGATMFNLLTLQKPPRPSDIEEDSHSALQLPKGISRKTEKLIFWLMKPNRKMRPQSVADVKQYLVETPSDPVQEDISVTPDDDTLLKDQKTAQPVVPPLVPQPDPALGRWVRNAILAVLALTGMGIGVFVVRGCQPSEGGNEQQAELLDSTVIAPAAVDSVPMKQVTDYTVQVKAGPQNMRQYAYTGELVDTMGALPNGQGQAKFAKYGSIPASTYTGNFVNGVCEDATGRATMNFTTGEKYVGTFKGGYFDQGRYYSSDGSYFEGTFKGGSPYNGKWYTAAGEVDGSVVNGKDQ